VNNSKEFQPCSIIDIKATVESVGGPYLNDILTRLNDHVVRVSVMSEPYFWHCHPESDETFIVIEGQLGIEFEDQEVVLSTWELITVPRGVAHRTRPIGGRSVNLTVERGAATTKIIDVDRLGPRKSRNA
jgi:mannose-6-phosphate isomerase-like protein (cupin superfamily)